MSVGPITTGTGPVRDVKLGRLALTTIFSDVAETVGDTLESVGGGVVPGERRARPLTLTLPLYGSATEFDPFTVGDRMRRQMRALMENTRAKLNSFYFQFAVDPELNAWLIVGGGQISYGPGGLTFADFQLQLQDSYKIGSRRTHRPARRVELYDRRVSTTARDLLGTVFSTDFAAITALPIVYLPIGVTDVTGYSKRVVSFGTRISISGNVAVIQGASHAEVLSFEWPEAQIHKNDDVVIYDRRGQLSTTPLSWSARVLNDVPIMFLRFGESAGNTIATDLSDSNLTATYVGAAQLGYSPGAVADPDTAVGLNGTEGVYVNAVDTAVLRVTGDLSAEGWILPLPGTPNLVVNPTFELDAFGWVSATDANVTVSTFARQTGWFSVGSASLRMTATSTGSAISTAGAVANTLAGVDGFPIKASTSYTASAQLNVLAAGQGHQMVIAWYDTGGSFINQTNGTTVTGTGLKTVTVTGPSPSNAAYALAEVRSIVGTSGSTDTYIDAVQLTEGITAPAWLNLRPRYDTIVSKWRSASGKRAYRFAYDSYLGVLVMEVSSNGTLRSIANSLAVSVPTGVWTHVGFSYVASTGIVSFIRNGIVISSSSGLPTNIFAGTSQLSIGKWEAEA